MTESDCGLPDEPAAAAPERLTPARVRELYDQWSSEVRAFLRGLTRSSEQAEELLQVTFGRLVEAGHTARDESIRGWLFRVAYNETMLWRRRTGVQERGLRKVAPGSKRHDDAAPWAGLVRSEDVERVRQALATLPAEQRQVVEQRVYADKTFAQIAGELQLPIGTVLTRMRLALSKLQQRLRDE